MDAAGLDLSYLKHYDAYCRIFDRCGLKYMVIDAHSGAMGGSQSQEFMVRTPAGEDQVVSCEKCAYAANMEKATSKLAPIEDLKPEGDGQPLEVHTPGQKTIEDVARFLGVSPKNIIKTLAFVSTLKTPRGEDRTPVIVFLRGDQTLNEAKSASIFPPGEVRPMTAEEIEEVFGCPPGFIGPRRNLPWRKLGDKRVQVYFDNALLGRANLIAGANRIDYHVKNVTLFGEGTGMWGEWGKWKEFIDESAPKMSDIRTDDILSGKEPEDADLRSVTAGEACPDCGAPLRIDTAVEVGHIFKLGYKYSESMRARVLDRNGKEVAPIMGSYGIGIERILTAAVEQNNDENGFWLPPSIAPFEVVVVATNTKDETIRTTAEEVARQLEASGYDVLLDDRDERPGVKFKDADLVGIPVRVNVGKKVTEGMLEVVQRSTRQTVDVKISAITEYFQELRPAAR
jgi:prolyl-tRNA synthetase